MTAKGTLKEGETVMFDECLNCGATFTDIHICPYQLRFGVDTIASLKEKQKKEKAAKKKLPKNHKPQDH